MKITNNEQLALILKVKGLQVKDFDYVEGKTKESYLVDHPMVYYGRRFYENPYLWKAVFDLGLDEAIAYLYSLDSMVDDIVAIKGALATTNTTSKVPMRMVVRYIESSAKRFKGDSEGWKGLEENVDSILEHLAAIGKPVWFKATVKAAEANGVDPIHGSFGNAGKGMALYSSTTKEALTSPWYDKFAFYLLEIGADPSLNDSLPFCMACKHRAYALALAMVNKGADLHAKKDLGLTMIALNDSKQFNLSDEDATAREALLTRYVADKKANETAEEADAK